MSFLNPAAFYLIGTIPLVIALHFLRLRRQSFVVPSMMLWRANPEDQKANVPFQRLRNWLLPIIQSLFLLVIIISIARPALRIPGIIHGQIIFIIDNSASMLSREMGDTRLELAKQEVLSHIKQVSASGGIMIMSTHTPQAHIHQTFTTDKDKIRNAVRDISPTHTVGELTSVFDSASRYIDSENDQVYYVSDSFANLPVTSIPINKIAVGDSAKNIGIVQFNVERFSDQFKILARIKNWTDTNREITAQIALEGGGVIDEKTVSLPADKEKSILFSFNADRLEGKAVSLQLTNTKDDFDLDNKAWAILNPEKQLQILLISDRKQPLLTNLLNSYSEYVHLQAISVDEFHGSADADVTIIDGNDLSTTLNLTTIDTDGIIYINWQSELPFIEQNTIEIVESPVSIISENKTHPIMQYVSLNGVDVKQSLKRVLPIWAESLVETEKGTLIWGGSNANRQYIVFEFDAFNPEISDFPFFIPEVPIFIYRCLSWLEANTAPIRSLTHQQNRTGQFFRSGEQLLIEIPTQDQTIIAVEKPNGMKIELQNKVFTETDQIGIYSVYVENTLNERFAVNLLDENESNLSISEFAPITKEDIKDKELLQPLTREVWQWVGLIGVCLLLCEWWFYHRD